MKFEELEINESIHKAIRDIGYSELTPIQAEAIPHALAGRDITGLAQTGTGKTIAFLIPAINFMLNQKPKFPAILVLAPTRELVYQIAEEATRLLKYTDITVASIIGGTDYKSQEIALNDNTGVIVATPGRLIDLVKSGKCNIADTSVLIVDEADRMFDMGFFQDLRYIIHHCKDRKQTMLFSATLSYDVMMLASRFLNEAVNVEIEPEKMITEKIDQQLYHLGIDEKLAYLVNLITKDTREDQGIIFTNYKSNIPVIVNTLRKYGVATTGISSQLDQKKRMRLLRDFKEGKYRYMVATDVASRGIDVENIGVVYNYDMPMDTENYVHRIGRTARAGRTGVSISFCSERDYSDLVRIEAYLKMGIPVQRVEDSYLALPEGNFTKFEAEDVYSKAEASRAERQPNNKRGNMNKNKKPFSPRTEGSQSSPSDSRQPNRDRKPAGKGYKGGGRKEEKIHPVDEAKMYLQKADSVMGTVPEDKNKAKDKRPKNRKFNKNKPKHHHADQASKPYDKTKRNLFDANDYKEAEVKKSVWQKIKSIFGG